MTTARLPSSILLTLALAMLSCSSGDQDADGSVFTSAGGSHGGGQADTPPWPSPPANTGSKSGSATGGTTGGIGSGEKPMGNPSFTGPFCEGKPRHVIGLETRPASAQPSVQEMRAYMLKAVNMIRATTSLPPLKLDDCLNKIADAAIADVNGGGSVHGYFLANCMNAAHGFGKSCECGWAQENYGAAGGSSYAWTDTMNVPLCGMMDEPKGQGHRGNIESAQWTRLGVGVSGSGGSWKWIHEFGR